MSYEVTNDQLKDHFRDALADAERGDRDAVPGHHLGHLRVPHPLGLAVGEDDHVLLPRVALEELFVRRVERGLS